MSAKANAPSVVPHLIISDTGEVNAKRFLSWWETNGGMVHRWNLSFYPRLHSAVHEKKWHDAGWLSQYGTYLKVDIPLIIKERIQAPGKMVGDIRDARPQHGCRVSVSYLYRFISVRLLKQIQLIS